MANGSAKPRPKLLTPKQEAFCLAVVSGMTASDAYRHSYNVRPGTKPESIWRRGSGLMANGMVLSRIRELRQPVAEAAQYDLKKAMDEAETARLLALKKGHAAAAVQATALKARMNGLLVEERRNERNPLKDLTDDELDNYASRLADQHTAIAGEGADRPGKVTTH